jgi:hypothetical protein
MADITIRCDSASGLSELLHNIMSWSNQHSWRLREYLPVSKPQATAEPHQRDHLSKASLSLASDTPPLDGADNRRISGVVIISLKKTIAFLSILLPKQGTTKLIQSHNMNTTARAKSSSSRTHRAYSILGFFFALSTDPSALRPGCASVNAPLTTTSRCLRLYQRRFCPPLRPAQIQPDDAHKLQSHAWLRLRWLATSGIIISENLSSPLKRGGSLPKRVC